MCLYPTLIKNPKYLPNKKNNYNEPQPTDNRVKYVAIGCGNCIECRTQKARQWQVRLSEELKIHKYAYFVTLTFNDLSLSDLSNEIGAKDTLNAIATLAIRRFLERWRKKHKKSIKHWLVTELGHTNTERLHIHGILFNETEITNEELQSIWQYGITDTGKYCNQRTINYVVKYIMKIDNDHKFYKAEIFASAGIGKNFVNENTKNIYKYKPHNSKEFYILPNGTKVNLPIYYRNKFYNEEEREKMWCDRLDKKTIFVRGIEIKNIDTPEGFKIYADTLHDQQLINKSLGYGSDIKEWKFEEYNHTLKMLNKGASVR